MAQPVTAEKSFAILVPGIRHCGPWIPDPPTSRSGRTSGCRGLKIIHELIAYNLETTLLKKCLKEGSEETSLLERERALWAKQADKTTDRLIRWIFSDLV